MHPLIVYHLVQARTAELDQQAQRDAPAQAAGRARHTRIPRRRRRARGLPAVEALRALAVRVGGSR
jgi:hypothetical protein